MNRSFAPAERGMAVASCMSTARSNMTVRVVSLHSPEAGESRVAGTPSDRVALVAVLSADLWARTQQSPPVYDRATMPLRVARLAKRG